MLIGLCTPVSILRANGSSNHILCRFADLLISLICDKRHLQSTVSSSSINFLTMLNRHYYPFAA